jgi:hypothetical protein
LLEAGWPEHTIQAAFATSPANNSAAAPVSVVQHTHEPSTIASTRSVQIRKAGRNPFVHLLNGIRHLFHTNPFASLGLIIIMTLTTMLGSIFLIGMLMAVIVSFIFSADHRFSAVAIGLFIASLLLFIVVTFYLNVALNRLIISSLRGNVEHIRQILRFTLRRFPLALRVVLTIGAVTIAAFTASAFAARISPILSALLSIVLIVMVLIWALRLSFLATAIADETTEPSVKGVIQRSTAVWKQNAVAVILFFLVIVMIYFLLQLIPDASPSYTSVGQSSNIGIAGGYATAIVSSIVGTTIMVMFMAGFADIYAEATDTPSQQNISQ